MTEMKWAEVLPVSITVTDETGIITFMNNRSAESFADFGGSDLVGKNMAEFHNIHASAVIDNMIYRNESNIYTIEKKGKKKLVYQSPLYEGEKFIGTAEIEIELPETIPNFKRD